MIAALPTFIPGQVSPLQPFTGADQGACLTITLPAAGENFLALILGMAAPTPSAADVMPATDAPATAPKKDKDATDVSAVIGNAMMPLPIEVALIATDVSSTSKSLSSVSTTDVVSAEIQQPGIAPTVRLAVQPEKKTLEAGVATPEPADIRPPAFDFESPPVHQLPVRVHTDSLAQTHSYGRKPADAPPPTRDFEAPPAQPLAAHVQADSPVQGHPYGPELVDPPPALDPKATPTQPLLVDVQTNSPARGHRYGPEGADTPRPALDSEASPVQPLPVRVHNDSRAQGHPYGPKPADASPPAFAAEAPPVQPLPVHIQTDFPAQGHPYRPEPADAAPQALASEAPPVQPLPVQVHPDSPAPGPAYGHATGQQHDAWQRSIEYVAAETQPPTEAPHVVPAATPPGLLRAIDVVPAMPLGTPTMTMIANPIPAAPEYTVAPEYFVTPVREWEPRGNDEVKAVVSSPTILDTRETSSVRHIEESRAPTSLTDQVHQHLSTNLEQLRETGRVEVQMILHPPELGNVKLHLALDDGHLSVRFLVQNDAAKNALDHQMEPMRARFAEMGFSLGQFDVRRDGTSSSWQTPFDASADVRPASSTTGPEVQAATAKRGSSNGLIDVLA